MIFNLANPYELDKYKEYVNTLFKKKSVVEVKEVYNLPRHRLQAVSCNYDIGNPSAIASYRKPNLQEVHYDGHHDHAVDGLNAEVPTDDKARNDEKYSIDNQHHSTNRNGSARKVINQE